MLSQGQIPISQIWWFIKTFITMQTLLRNGFLQTVQQDSKPCLMISLHWLMPSRMHTNYIQQQKSIEHGWDIRAAWKRFLNTMETMITLFHILTKLNWNVRIVCQKFFKSPMLYQFGFSHSNLPFAHKSKTGQNNNNNNTLMLHNKSNKIVCQKERLQQMHLPLLPSLFSWIKQRTIKSIQNLLHCSMLTAWLFMQWNTEFVVAGDLNQLFLHDWMNWWNYVILWASVVSMTFSLSKQQNAACLSFYKSSVPVLHVTWRHASGSIVAIIFGQSTVLVVHM